MTYNTGNPIGSTDARDRSDNSENLDYAVNSLALTFNDRLGVTRDTLEGVYQKSAYYRAGTFDVGYTLTNNRQTLAYGNIEYSWSGAFPKVVPAGSTPASTGGVGAGAWVDRTDVTLRQELLLKALKVVNGDIYLKDFISIYEYGVIFNGVTDSTQALINAFASGKKIYIPDVGAGNHAVISNTVTISDDTVIWSENPSRVVIKCSALMSPDLHSVCTKNYNDGVLIANRNIRIFGLNVDSNGYERGALSTTSSGVGLVVNAENSEIDSVTISNSPEWNFFFTSGNPFELVGHNGSATAYSKNITAKRLTSNDPIGGDGLIIQGTIDSNFSDFTNTISASLAPSKTILDTGFQVIEGCHNLEINGLKFFHNGAISSGVVISSHDKKEFISNIKIDGIYGHKLSKLFATWSDTATQPIGDSSWLTRGCYVKNVHLDYPVLDTDSTSMQARLIDVQNMMDVRVENISARIKENGGAFSSPTCSINFAGAHDITIDGVKITGIPDVGLNSYLVGKTRGWINVSDSASKNITVRDIRLENFGYFNRVISDTASGAIKRIDGLRVDSVVIDGGTKEVIVSAADNLIATGLYDAPSGSTLGRFSSTFIAETGNDIRVKRALPDKIIGGLRVRSTTTGGVQDQSGILFDRQFVSAGSSNGKGSIAWRTSAAVPGSLSFAAYNEDSDTYVPLATMTYSSVSTPTKAFAPTISGDTNLGQASASWLNGYFTNAPQTTSDARLKTQPRDITDAESEAFYLISKLPMVWKWLNKPDDTARMHSGPTVQAAMEIMGACGLNWSDYSCFCHDHIDAQPEKAVVVAATYDDDGSLLSEEETVIIPAIPEVDIYSFRKSELLWWCMRSIVNKISSIEDRISRLELK